LKFEAASYICMPPCSARSHMNVSSFSF